MEVPGRSCPLVYRYQPEALAQPAELKADTLYVVGGLYGNPAALRALLERTDRESGGAPAIVFNGDSSRGLAAAGAAELVEQLAGTYALCVAGGPAGTLDRRHISVACQPDAVDTHNVMRPFG